LDRTGRGLVSYTAAVQLRAEVRRLHGECGARQQRIEHLLGVIAQKDSYIHTLESRLDKTARPGEVEAAGSAAYSDMQASEEPS
jgi:hypothetical protein